MVLTRGLSFDCGQMLTGLDILDDMFIAAGKCWLMSGSLVGVWIGAPTHAPAQHSSLRAVGLLMWQWLPPGRVSQRTRQKLCGIS